MPQDQHQRWRRRQWWKCRQPDDQTSDHESPSRDLDGSKAAAADSSSSSSSRRRRRRSNGGEQKLVGFAVVTTGDPQVPPQRGFVGLRESVHVLYQPAAYLVKRRPPELTGSINRRHRRRAFDRPASGVRYQTVPFQACKVTLLRRRKNKSRRRRTTTTTSKSAATSL